MGMAKTDSTFYFRSKIIIVLTTTDSNTVGTGKCQYWRTWSLNFRILFHNIINIITINNITTLFSIKCRHHNHHQNKNVECFQCHCWRSSPFARNLFDERHMPTIQQIPAFTHCQHLKCRVTGKQISKGSHHEFTKFQKEIQ